MIRTPTSDTDSDTNIDGSPDGGIGTDAGIDSGVAFCGDGVPNGDEVCDDGTNAGANVGDCAPDCSVVVVKKRIVLSLQTDGALVSSGTAIEGADAMRDPGFKTMFAYGDQRVATVTPNKGDSQVDWVLTPWVAYYTEESDDKHIWTTDESALLGVTDGIAQALVNPIDNLTNGVWTGMETDWTIHRENNCNGWTVDDDSYEAPIGNYGYVDRRFLRTGAPDFLNTCDLTRSLYCVEQ